MMKQFNFYDIYGYLIPGMLMLGIVWAPIGVVTKSVPDQDLSKALFLAVLAYIVGHLLRVVSSSVVPSTIRKSSRERVVSDYVLDQSSGKFSEAFKLRLQEQIQTLFGISLEVGKDGDGKNNVSRNRNTAFFQARAYLISKKSAAYAEQFEGLYSMMRGLGCSLYIGVAYFAGWWLAYYGNRPYVTKTILVLSAFGLVGTVTLAPRLKLKGAGLKMAAGSFWLINFLGLGFWLGISSAKHYGGLPSANVHSLWPIGILMMLVAAIKCFAAYGEFAENFAMTVWRDFSTCVAYGSAPEADHPDVEKE